MRARLWGTRGSLATPGTEMLRYGGNTSSVSVEGVDGTVLALDAGTGLRRLGLALPRELRRVDVLLTHLHMDHIQGLGFFAPLYNPAMEVHLWGPASTTLDLRSRLMRYLSPPLFPVRLGELPCRLHLHETPCAEFEIGEFRISSALICHPGPTVGYRIRAGKTTMAYVTDHEPALGVPGFPIGAEWTSGYSLAAETDLLIHDAQYSSAQYPRFVGWGHSSMEHAIRFAALAHVRHAVLFHHDPAHSDEDLDRLTAEAIAATQPACTVTAGAEGDVFELGPD